VAGTKQRQAESALTAALFRPISRSVLAIDPPAKRQSLIYAEMLKKADEIAADRKARVVALSKLELPAIFYWRPQILSRGRSADIAGRKSRKTGSNSFRHQVISYQERACR
jgi:hypothetical protein